MSYWNHYRTAAPSTWGTSSYQFGPPPTPAFRPQPSWGGLDYYRAHAVSPDPSLYNHAWNRISSPGGIAGVGMHEARHFHRLVYGGLGDLQALSPTELGHAAAYEAYRTWIDNSSIYEPISADRARQREALIGLSIAEVTRLLHSMSRTPDRYTRMEACEAAAATGSILCSLSVDEEYANLPHHSRSLSRSRSLSASSGYPIEGYTYDDERIRPRHGHSHRRHSSTSLMGLPPMQTGPIYYGDASSNPIGVPSVAGSAYGVPAYNDGRISPFGGAGAYGAPGTSPYNFAGTSPYNSGVVPYNALGSSYPNQPPYQQPMMYGTSPSHVSIPHGSTLVIEQPTHRSSHKHRHHKHGSGHRHHRHRSNSDASYTTVPIYTTTGYQY